MKFEVDTALGLEHKNKDNAPCKNATIEEIKHFPDGAIRYIKWAIEINTLEELLELIDEVGSSLVVQEGFITIYDDWLE